MQSYIGLYKASIYKPTHTIIHKPIYSLDCYIIVYEMLKLPDISLHKLEYNFIKRIILEFIFYKIMLK